MPQQIELKLAVDAHDIPRLRHSEILRGSSVAHTPRTRLVSVYYDTPSWSLKRGAILLRVRKQGRARRRVQSVKMQAAGPGSLSRRIESESRITGDRPSLVEMKDASVRRLIETRCGREALVPVFATDVERETWLLRVGRSRIECVIDRGTVTANGRTAPICEVELELKSGQPASLFQLGHRLNAVVPLRIEAASKAERGYKLAGGTAPVVATAGTVQLDAAASLARSFATIAQGGLTDVLRHAESAYETDDPEAIHQLRVAIRRLRAAFSLFKDASAVDVPLPLAGALGAMARRLGAAREWDVLIEDTLARMPGKLRRSAAGLIKIAQARREEGHRKAHAALRDQHTTDVLLRLERWIDQRLAPPDGEGAEAAPRSAAHGVPTGRFAGEALGARHRKVLKLGRRIDQLDPEELHGLRIRIKKLRYASEFFAAIWPSRRAERYLSALKRLQQILGTLHDTMVAPKLVGNLAAAGGPAAATAAGRVERWLIGCQQRDRKRGLVAWRKFAQRKRFWEEA